MRVNVLEVLVLLEDLVSQALRYLLDGALRDGGLARVEAYFFVRILRGGLLDRRQNQLLGVLSSVLISKAILDFLKLDLLDPLLQGFQNCFELLVVRLLLPSRGCRSRSPGSW